VRIGAQGTDGFAEVHTGSGWRAVTKDGVQSGPGGMDYDHDMAPYVQEMVDWLDDDSKPHPLRFERAFHGLEIMSALYRSAIEGGQVALPLTTGQDELDGLRGRVPNRKVMMTLAESAKEYKS
jgi:predicted dehydrogenase